MTRDEQLGLHVRNRRRFVGLTQLQLAQKLGVQHQLIHKYECGSTRMSAVRLWEIAEALECSVASFFENLSSMKGSPT